jgi:hypothetical protein
VRSLPLLLLLLTVPLFLAGYLYLSYLREVDGRGVLRMQKWNMFGGAIGGAAECVVIVMGFRNSIWVAFGFYLVGLISILSLRLRGSEASSRTIPISS